MDDLLMLANKGVMILLPFVCKNRLHSHYEQREKPSLHIRAVSRLSPLDLL